MKAVQRALSKKWDGVIIDPLLDENSDKILYPDKLEQANRALKSAKLPPNKHKP